MSSVRMELTRQHSQRGVFEMAQYQITVDSQLLQQLFLGNSQDTGVAKLFLWGGKYIIKFYIFKFVS